MNLLLFAWILAHVLKSLLMHWLLINTFHFQFVLKSPVPD